jgi:predicted nucleotidyltransferase
MCKRDETILSELKSRIPEQIRSRIRRIILFGSRARGDEQEESDLDLVIIVDEKDSELERELQDLAYVVMCDFDFMPIISLRVFSFAQFEDAVGRELSFYVNLEREGVVI